MLLNIETTSEDQLIRTLSPEAIDYFSDLEIDDSWPNGTNPDMLKFVRFGGEIVLGSTLQHGPAIGYRSSDSEPIRKRIAHDDLVRWANDRRLDAQDPLSGDSLMDQNAGLHDAGFTSIMSYTVEIPKLLILGGGSLNYGQATQANRANTVTVAESILGSNIKVISNS